MYMNHVGLLDHMQAIDWDAKKFCSKATLKFYKVYGLKIARLNTDDVTSIYAEESREQKIAPLTCHSERH